MYLISADAVVPQFGKTAAVVAAGYREKNEEETMDLLAVLWMVGLCTLFAGIEPVVNAIVRWVERRRYRRLIAAIATGIVPGFKY